MQVDLIVQRKDNCLIQYIDQDQFCAGNTLKKKDTCNGDSGGPLVSFIFNFLKKESIIYFKCFFDSIRQA